MRDDKDIRVLSLFWNFTVGGIAQYAALLEGVSEYAPISIRSISVLGPRHHANHALLNELNDKVIISRSGLLDVRWLKALRKELRVWRPDIVMSHGFNSHFMARICAVLSDKPFRPVCSYHGLYHPPTSARRLVAGVYNRFTEGYIRRRACSTIAVAEYCRDYLLGHGVDPGRVQVIHNGIPQVEKNILARGKLRSEWGVSQDEILVGVASRLDPVKGVEYLVNAFKGVAARNENVKLVLIGSGSLDENLRSRVTMHGLEDRVVFTGFRTDIADCLDAMDIFVLPSLAEYHSIGLLEAMRAGKAIIATNVGGNTESARHGQEALIVPPADSNAIEASLEKLIADKELRIRFGVKARERYLEEFTVNQMIKHSAEWFVNIAQQPIPCR